MKEKQTQQEFEGDKMKEKQTQQEFEGDKMFQIV